MNLLEEHKFKIKVSSVLNKDTKQNGKKFLTDGQVDTAWSSDQGTDQWIVLEFDEEISMNGFSFQFQGGFAGKNCAIIIESAEGNVLVDEPFYPEDINSVQTFNLRSPVSNKLAKRLKFTFDESTDFFGRIIVYDLKIF